MKNPFLPVCSGRFLAHRSPQEVHFPLGAWGTKVMQTLQTLRDDRGCMWLPRDSCIYIRNLPSLSFLLTRAQYDSIVYHINSCVDICFTVRLWGPCSRAPSIITDSFSERITSLLCGTRIGPSRSSPHFSDHRTHLFKLGLWGHHFSRSLFLL